MSTYSKCLGTNCLKRDSCFRYNVESLPKYRPWLVESVSIPDPEKCKWYIPNETEINP